mgnify:CR=1 FL=1
MTHNPSIVLTEDLLARCRARAANHDRDNTFFNEDLAELSEAGYLRMAVPRKLGGLGLPMELAHAETRRLARYAPATALALNMHVYWTGMAADLRRAGDRSLEWLLEEAIQGEIFAAGHGEIGNDLPVLMSTSRAEPVPGGYRVSGHKIFGSLAPVWTRLGVHALDASEPQNPRIVHLFVPRDSAGLTVKRTWDTLGMRATQSDDTVMEDVFVPEHYVSRHVPPGEMDAFVLGIFAWGLLGFASVYLGIAERAMELTVAGLHRKRALGVSRSLAYHPHAQHTVARMSLALEAMIPHWEKTLRDWSQEVDHGPRWPALIAATKHHCVTGCWEVVDQAMDLSGGGGMFRGNEMERLFRDARCGRFHPANSALAHEIIGKTALGIDMGEQPRWG